MTTTNSVVANAIKAQAVRNSVEVEISPGYAARVQHAMRDAARAISGVRMTSTNTLECRDEDAADDVIDILKQAGLPDGEVWTNAKRVARNERLVPFDRDAVKPGDSVWFKGREFEYKGSHGSLLVELEDVFDGEAEFVSPYDRNLKMAANARTARNADYTDATNRLRFCLDSLYKADDYRNEAVGTVAQLINEGVIDKSAGAKMNELQRLLAQAMAVGKDLYYNRIRP